MATDNYAIADQFSLLAKLMDIHGENSFKTKSYAVAAFTIEKLPGQLADLPHEKIFAIKGIGDAIGKKIIAILNTGELVQLTEYIRKTPPGVMEMLNIKGLGPKKIALIWKEMEIESIGELLYACTENRLSRYKGFGEKTQQNVKDTLSFYLKHQGSYLYAQAENFVLGMDKKLKTAFPNCLFEITGDFKRHTEVISRLEWVTTATPETLSHFFENAGFTTTSQDQTHYACRGTEGLVLHFHSVTTSDLFARLFETSCSEPFLTAWKEKTGSQTITPAVSEEDRFNTANLHFIPAFLREKAGIIEQAAKQPLPDVIKPGDIRAIIHSHSNWSDGSNTIEEMATACMEKGYAYLVISDHSKSAFYANGLQEDRIKAQHAQVDELNAKLAPFKIFKSIECDILNDGQLDYAPSILSTFDLVIASVHANLKMTEEKAMMRLLGAIQNPYTTILGHMTGRLLLSRPGYPVDHKTIIDACAANQVVIELNAHPRRLDMDWRWIDYALEKGVLISIDPDAHSIEGYADSRYGVLAAQKAQLTKEKNLSSFELPAFEAFLANRKQAKGI